MGGEQHQLETNLNTPDVNYGVQRWVGGVGGWGVKFGHHPGLNGELYDLVWRAPQLNDLAMIYYKTKSQK